MYLVVIDIKPNELGLKLNPIPEAYIDYNYICEISKNSNKQQEIN